MKVLLVNPNRFQKPPVIPLGLEYLFISLKEKNYEVEILDLCFCDDPLAEIQNLLNKQNYDLIGITIRNVDSVLFYNNEYFLSKIKKIVDITKIFQIPIVLGGIGYSIAPKKILKYLKADFGIIGPGERAIVKLLEDIENRGIKNIDYKLINGWDLGLDRDVVYKRTTNIDYNQYLEEDGIVGFETQKGCKNKCSYCVEANKRLYFKDPKNVIGEIADLVEKGYGHFHLCDSEFNQSLKHCKKFLRELIAWIKREKKERNDFRWALYMVPNTYDEELFALLMKSNAYLITLSVVSDEKEQENTSYNYQDVEKIIQYCNKYEIKIAIDLMVGFPGEKLQSIAKAIQFFRIYKPSSVGINFIFRLYECMQLTEYIFQNEIHASKVYPEISLSSNKELDLLQPHFFRGIKLEAIEKLINKESLFKVEGLQDSVNYQRI
ncbi:MAG: radical SAM protein [Candidatus Lokiarchaeota archaeon]|nr:radical SAM protein [Candidatus Lokiarchaeota archaeon]